MTIYHLKWLNLSEIETINFLHACSISKKKGMALLDIKYHFFVRALEGLYYCLTGDKEVFLDRKETIVRDNGQEDKVFEISICKNCGDIAIVGNIVDDYLISREKSIIRRISLKCGPNYIFLSVLLVKRKFLIHEYMIKIKIFSPKADHLTINCML